MHLGFRPIKSDWARVCTPKQYPRPRHFPARGPRGPPLHQIMTTGTPLDPVVICLGLRADNHSERVASSKGTVLTVGQRASLTVNINRCPANCNSWTTFKRDQEEELSARRLNTKGLTSQDEHSLPQMSPTHLQSSFLFLP